MIRILSNGLAAVGLAAAVALVALMSGSAVVKPAEAAPTAVTVTSGAPVNCSVTITATVTDSAPPYIGLVTFTTNLGTITASSTAVAGVATATLTVPAGSITAATVTATAAPAPAGVGVVSFNSTNCPTVVNNCLLNPYGIGCTGYPFGTGFGACDPYSYLGGAYGGSFGGAYGGAYGGCNNTGCGTQYAGLPGQYANLYGGQYSGVLPQYGAQYGAQYGGAYGCGSNFGACSNAFGPILNCTSGYGGYNPGFSTQFAAGRVSILPSASSVACGGATAITVTVTDPSGFKVADGTNVTFTTSLGYVGANDQTVGGTAVSSLTIPPGTSGSARVTASAGGQSADTTINVTCATGAPAVVVQPLPVAPAPFPFQVAPRPVIVPPSTGDAGLAAD